MRVCSKFLNDKISEENKTERHWDAKRPTASMTRDWRVTLDCKKYYDLESKLENIKKLEQNQLI